ncbi:MAG: pyridoxal-phosphate-dependent aminotransferase family protein [Gemmatimonadales bacterium]
MTTFGRNFLPGPTDVHPEVLEAMATPMVAHRGTRMRQLLAGMQPALRELFGTTQPVLLSTSSATGLLEAAVRSGVRERLLVAAGGYFGEYFARIAEQCGKQVIRVQVHPGTSVTAEQLERFLEGPPVDAVAVVHSESSTGALADVESLARVVRARKDILFLVDGVTAVAAMPFEMDRWGVDFVCTGSQKALAMPPGLGLGAASQRFLERAAGRRDAGYYFSVQRLARMANENLPIWTPAVSLIVTLERQLGRILRSGGWPARYARHRTMLETLERWIAAHPALRLLAEPGQRSPAISAVVVPAELPAADVVAEAERRGFLIGGGLNPRYGNVFRIGHMGDLEPAHLVALLAQLEEVLP